MLIERFDNEELRELAFYFNFDWETAIPDALPEALLVDLLEHGRLRDLMDWFQRYRLDIITHPTLTTQWDRVALYETLSRLTLAQLRAAAEALDFDAAGLESHTHIAVDLIGYLERHARLDRLVEWLTAQNPTITSEALAAKPTPFPSANDAQPVASPTWDRQALFHLLTQLSYEDLRPIAFALRSNSHGQTKARLVRELMTKAEKGGQLDWLVEWLTTHHPTLDTVPLLAQPVAPRIPGIPKVDEAALADVLMERFSLDEIQTLIYSLNLSPADVLDDSKSDTVQRLIEYAQAHGRLDELIGWIINQRPDTITLLATKPPASDEAGSAWDRLAASTRNFISALFGKQRPR